MNKNGLFGFAANSSCWFSSITSGNRLKLWDTASNDLSQQYTGKDLNNAFTAIATIRTAGVKKQKNQQGLIALGTENGTIVIFRLDLGEVSHRLGGPGSDGHASRVNDLVFNAEGTVLYSCSQDKNIIEWDLASGAMVKRFKGGKVGVTKLCISPDGSQLLSAANALKLWDLSSKKVVRKYTGHSSAVTSLAFSPDGNYFASGAGDRYVSMWEVQSEASDDKERTSIQTFTLDSPPTSLKFNPHVAGKGKKRAQKLHMCAVTANNQGYIWEWAVPKGSSPSAGAPTTTPDCLITIPVPKTKKIKEDKKGNKKRKASGQSSADGLVSQLALLDLCFESTNQIMVAGGSVVHPSCQVLDYRDSDAIKAALVFAPSATGSLIKATAGVGSVRVPGSNGSVAISAAASLIARQASALDGAGDSRAKRAKHESTLAELVRQAEAKAQTNDFSRFAGGVSNAASLVSILSQALHSGDEALIDYCLREGSRSDKVVIGTVDRLAPKHVRPLLEATVLRYRSKPSRGVFLMTWVRHILNTHTSYLMSVGETGESMAQLHKLISHRLSVNKKLLHLNGRLELVLAQAARQFSQPTGTGAGGVAPLVFGVEDEEEDSEDQAAQKDDDDDEEEEEEEEEEDEDDEDDSMEDDEE